jgi:type VI secretion system protein ImpF
MPGTILDRLIEKEIGNPEGSVQYRQASFNQVRDAVGRDLENLLNTKNFMSDIPAEFKEINRSVLVYGLPDFTALNPRTLEVGNDLLEAIERTVSIFEPRLQNVAVSIDDADKDDSGVRFRIAAVLSVDPYIEPVRFDTVFDSNRGEYSIK